MVDILVKNGLILTMNQKRRILEDGAVAIEDGCIIAVGKTGDISRDFKAEKVIDASGKIIMPGLVCSHTHLYGMLLRGAPLFARMEPPADFTQILQRVWWPVDEAMNCQDAYASALVGCLEFLKTGTTFFADTYSGPNSIENVLDQIARAVNEVGIKGIIAYEATERHSKEEGERGIRENIRFIKKTGGKGKVRGMFSIHASFTVSNDLIRRVRELANAYKAPATMHVSEGLSDVYHNMERYGKRTIERLNDVGLLGPDVVLAHCVNINQNELEILAKTRANVAHNPMSNMLNAVGVAPVPKMLEKGIPVGLGNDGYIFDGFENLRAAYLLHKVHARDPRVITPLQVIEMATIRGAELYGLEKEIGSIEVGKKADIIIIKPDVLPTPLTSQSVYGHLVNTVDGDDVEMTIVDGKVLMENRKVLTVNEEEAEKTAQKTADELWRRLEEVRPQVDVLGPL